MSYLDYYKYNNNNIYTSPEEIKEGTNKMYQNIFEYLKTVDCVDSKGITLTGQSRRLIEELIDAIACGKPC